MLEPSQAPASALNKLQPNLSEAGISKEAGWDGALTQDELDKIVALGEVRRLATARPTCSATTVPLPPPHPARRSVS